MAWGCFKLWGDWEPLISQYYLGWFFGAGTILGVCLWYYLFYVRPKYYHSIQVFSDHLIIHTHHQQISVYFEHVESVQKVWGSIFYLKMKNGHKHYFNSAIERVDYIWEGVYACRPDLIAHDQYEDFRVKLVQYDHHQKRREWFFKHKILDLMNWILVPLGFMLLSYSFQSDYAQIYKPSVYFFRLSMYSLLVMLIISLFYSLVVKKLVFDRHVDKNMGEHDEKSRDLEFEAHVLQRSKIFQMMTVSFLLALIIKFDVNLKSVTKVKEELAGFNLKKGHTLFVDNRYNCVQCKFRLHDGDIVIFGKGVIGQMMAQEGDLVGEVAQDQKGRMIASENIQEVPQGHVAVKAANGKDIIFVPIKDLIGKIQK
jgi:hypothetical protein